MNRLTRTKGVQGSTATLQAQRRSEDGGWEPDEGSFTDDQELTCVVWAGSDRQEVGSLPVTWEDADAAKFTVEFPLAFMEATEAGVYLAVVRLSDESAELARFELEIEEGPGTSEERPSYITFAEIQEEFPVGDSTQLPTDQTGYAALRAKARDWLDLLILSHFRGVPASAYTFPAYPEILPESNVWLANALAAGGLLLDTQNGARLRQAQVYWCLAQILKRAVGRAASSSNLLDLADEYARKAEATIQTAVAEIDTDADGKANYVVSFRSTVTRRRGLWH